MKNLHALTDHRPQTRNLDENVLVAESSVLKDYTDIASATSYDRKMYPNGGIKKADLTHSFILSPPVYLAKNIPITINKNKQMNYNSTLELARTRFENSLENDVIYK